MDYRNRIIKYLLLIPVYLAMAIPIGCYLSMSVSRDFTVGFFLCYFAIHFLITGIALLLKKGKWDLHVSVGVTILLMLIFRDKVLSLNMIAALMAAFIIFILRKKKYNRVGWIILAALETSLWIIVNYDDMPKIVAVCIVLLCIYALGNMMGRDVRYYLAVLFALGIAVAFIPVKEDPMQWTLVKKALAGVAKIVDKAGDELEYLGNVFFGGGAGYTGYSDSNAFGGNGVKSREREDMFIETGVKNGAMYLKGRSLLDMKEEGFSNEEVQTEPFNQWFVEYINALYNNDINKYEAACFSKIRRIDIEYRYLRTDDLIMPYHVLSVEDKPLRGFGGKKSRHFRYLLKYMAVDYANPYLVEVLKSEPGPCNDYETINEYVKLLYNINFDKIMSKEEYDAIAAEAKDFSGYTDTSMATQRIIDLTAKITEGCETDYEKAKAIETYLRQYSYSTQVVRAEGDNYIDRFLFEDEVGYCTYFASSMTLMLRLSGIPAKYTMGYAHRYKKEYSSVMSNEAHAWCEAYISGYGWVPFEPTPVKETAEDLGWGLTVSDTNKETVNVGTPTPYIPIPQNQGQNEAIDLDGLNIERKQEAFDKEGLIKFLSYIGAMVGFAVAVILLIKIILYIRYMLMTPERKLTENVRRIRKIVGDKAFKERNVRSIYEYADVIKDPGTREIMRRIFAEYYKVRFRGDEATDEMIKESGKLASYLGFHKKLIGGN